MSLANKLDELRELDKILESMGLSEEDRNTWFSTPNLVFGNRMPVSVVMDDEDGAKKIKSHLIALNQGNIGN
jgi:uncharacterized protein (DUF2384 family)